MRKFFDCAVLANIINNLGEEKAEEFKPVFDAVQKRYKALNKALEMSGLDPDSFVAAAGPMIRSAVKHGREVNAARLSRFAMNMVFRVEKYDREVYEAVLSKFAKNVVPWTERPRLYSRNSYNVVTDTQFVSEGELHAIRSAMKALRERHE